jgi:hypothetical protein
MSAAVVLANARSQARLALLKRELERWLTFCPSCLPVHWGAWVLSSSCWTAFTSPRGIPMHSPANWCRRFRAGLMRRALSDWHEMP